MLTTICCLLPLAFILFSATYTYLLNARRPADDPARRNYSPHAIWLAPITLPFLLVARVSLFVLWSLSFGLFLVAFPIALILIRKPFVITWLLRLARKIGKRLLEINGALLGQPVYGQRET